MNHSVRWTMSIGLCLGGLLVSSGLADTIYMSDGSELSGTILSEADQKVTLETAEGRKMVVLKKDVLYIARASTAPADVRKAIVVVRSTKSRSRAQYAP